VVHADAEGLRFDPESHTYEDLLVTISPDIKADLSGQRQIIGKWQNVEFNMTLFLLVLFWTFESLYCAEGIKAWITEGSATLYQSSRGWASIKTVK
jgi:hypothetical protein